METHELSGAAIFDVIRTSAHLYVEYGTGERELYDLRRDPWQLDNRVALADPGLVAALAGRLVALRNCASRECRRLEDLNVEPRDVPVAME